MTHFYSLASRRLKIFFALSILLCCVKPASSQTTLVAGDIAFTGYNGASSQSEFSFVILRTGGISAGTSIKFTDNGWNGSALTTTEGTITWTTSSSLPRFTEVRIKVSSPSSVSIGTIAPSGSFAISSTGDQVLAYQGTSTSPIFISGIHMNYETTNISTQSAWDNAAIAGSGMTSNRSAMPTGLTGGVNAIMGVKSSNLVERDNGLFNCSGSSFASSVSIMRSSINNPDNWTFQDTPLFSLPSSCSFSLIPLSVSVSVNQNVSCNGGANGSAAATGSGGTAPYSYSWIPSGGTGATKTALSAGSYTVTITDADNTTALTTFTITQPPAISVFSAKTDVSCNGGSNGAVSTSVSGGTSPYTYSWAPSGGTNSTASGLASGNYTVTITDNKGCTATRSYSITQPPAITATGTSTSVSCNGGNDGSAIITASGGTAPFTYAWAPAGGTAATATGLTAGSYTATVTDANGCTTTGTYAITQPPAIITTGTSTNVSCNGGNDGSATVAATGGAGSFTYSWSPAGGTASSASGLTAGSYTATVTDANGCTTTRTYAITQPPAITTTGTSTNVSCNGGGDGSATVTATGGAAPFTYAWTPAGGTAATATGLTAGSYTVTIVDANGCTTTRTYAITQPPAITTTGTSTNVSCNGGTDGSATVTATGGAGSFTYSWSPAGGTAATATGLAAGTYTATVTDANGCTATVAVSITEPATLTASISQTGISCNGANNGAAAVTTSGGTAPYSYLWSPSGGAAATANGLSAGTYTCIITDMKGCGTTKTATFTDPSAISASSTTTSSTCADNDGTINLSVTGGSPSYTFSWSNGAVTEDLSATAHGTYTVTIVDANGCSLQHVKSITQNCNTGVGTCQLVATECGQTFPDLTGYFDCIAVLNAQDYEWEFTNSGLGYSYIKQRGSAATNMLKTAIAGLIPGNTYNVKIKSKVAGVWGNYGPVCTVTISGSVQQTQLVSTECGQTVPDLSGYFNCNTVSGAQDYEWEFTNSGLGYSYVKQKGNGAAFMQKTLIVGLTPGNSYNVRIKAKVNGIWGSYGPTCVVTISGTIQSTQMVAAECGGSTSLAGYFNCNAVSGAQNYEWEFTNAGLGYSFTKLRGSGAANMVKSAIIGLTVGNTYNVRIRAQVGGVWGSFGPVCTVTISSASLVATNDPLRAFEENATVSSDPKNAYTLTTYPNPSGSEGFDVSIEGMNGEAHDITIQVFDLYGRIVWSEILLGKTDGPVVKINGDGSLAKGIYIVNANVDGTAIKQKVIVH